MTVKMEPLAVAAAGSQQGAIEAAWCAEFRRRIEDVESGRVQWLGADRADAELLAELAALDAVHGAAA